MRLAALWMVVAALALASGAAAGGPTDRLAISFEAPRAAVLMGSDISRSNWPMRLATPSEEGQFEVLVSKDAAPVSSPHCKSQYLIVRMPASVGKDPATRAAVARKRQEYARLLTAYNEGRPIRFEAFAGPYGKRLADGRIALSGCNLFFVEPKKIEH